MLLFLTEYSCSEFNDLVHGSLACDSDFLRVGSTCQFSCFLGYNLEGSANRTCLTNVSWSGIRSLCSPMKCKDVIQDPPPFVNVFQPCSGDFNTSCTVQCASGYTLVDDMGSVTSILCVLNENGTSVEWTEQPQCKGL